jgi:hypothetical protein
VFGNIRQAAHEKAAILPNIQLAQGIPSPCGFWSARTAPTISRQTVDYPTPIDGTISNGHESVVFPHTASQFRQIAASFDKPRSGKIISLVKSAIFIAS